MINHTIRESVHRLLNEFLRSAEVFSTSDDVTLEEYRELMKIFTPKLRHALALVGQLPDTIDPTSIDNNVLATDNLPH